MPKPLNLLLVEDSAEDAELLFSHLRRAGFDPRGKVVTMEHDYLAALDPALDLIVSDYRLPQFDGLRALELLKERKLEIPFILVSGTLTDGQAVEALRRGASDYLLKDRLSRIGAAVGQALERKSAQGALRASEERYRALWETTTDAVVLVDEHGVIRYANHAVEQMFGYAPEEAAGRPLTDLQAEHLRQAHREGFRRYLETGVKKLNWRAVEVIGLHRDGHEFPVEIAFSETSVGGERHFAGFLRDITERKQQQEKIARQTRIHAVLSGINSAIVRIRDRKELFDEACRIAVEDGNFGMAWIGEYDPVTFDVTPVASKGMDESATSMKASARSDIPQGQGMVGRAIREEKPVITNDISSDPGAGGSRRNYALRKGFQSIIAMPLMVDGKAVGTMVLFAREKNFFSEDEVKLLTQLAGDISFGLDHIEKGERIQYLAYYDSLTGHANRNLFHERLVQYVSAAQNEKRKLAVAVVDVDRFKTINDTFGRQAGDELLRQIAGRIEGHAGPIRMARISADRFAIVRSGVSSEGEVARLIEQWLAECFGPPFVVNGTELRVSAKAGVALFPDDGRDADALFGNAEAALKNAKTGGERYLFHTPQMTERIAEKFALENKLRQALEKEEFVLHYQPKVDTATGRINGVEALIRWQSPELGLVPPMDFIPLLEETGLILEVGAWALHRAVLDHRDWKDRGLPAPRISVNVSAVQLRRRDFVATVEDAIKLGAVPPGIDLEITESLVMEDIDANVEKLRAVRQLGLSIAVDDFGTGYSSLGYLAKLPVQLLKIDRSFIITMLKDPAVMALVSTIISLAHSLKLKVVAEGVDAEEQAKVLKRLRCDQMQGYLFSKPIPVNQLEKLITRNTPPPSSQTRIRRRRKT